MAVLTAISAIAGVVGTGLSIFGAIQQGQAANAAAQYQANVATVNANLAEENAKRVRAASDEEGYQQDQTARALFGEQEAGQAASGLSLQSESFVATRRSARKLARLDSLNLRQAGDVQAYGFRTDKANQLASAEFSRAQGKNALTSSYLDAASSLVGGATSLIGGGAKYGLSSTRRRTSSTDPWRGLRTSA